MFSFIKRMLLLAALCVPWATQAQELSTYSVTTSTTTYTSIANADSLLSSVDGDAGTQTVALPFNFDFGETTYLAGTNLTVRADGYIYFGSSSPGHSSKSAWTSTTNYSLIAPLITYDGKITANGATSGAYKALLSDDNGDAMLVIEFKGVQCYYTDYGSYNYQIRLHSNGNISAVYGSNTPTTNSSMVHNFFLINGASDKVCLTGSFASPVMGSPSALPNLSTMPANGAVITYNRPVISCPRPIFTFSNITNGSIDFSITPGGTETEWLYRLNGGNWESVTTTTSTISSLSSGTLYDVDYVAYCGAGDTSFAGSYTFRTMCDAILNSDLPYTYDFEDATGSGAAQSIDSCWRRYTNYTTAYPYPSTSYHHSGTKSLYFYSTNTYYSYVTLPPFDDDIEDLFLSFWAYKTSASYGHIYIGVMSDPADITTFDTIATLQVGRLSAWEHFEVPLSSYAGNGGVLAILSPNMSAASYVYIDDVVVSEPPTCLQPLAITGDNATASSIDITWTSTASDFVIEYGPTGFTQGQGTMVESSTNSVTLTGLSMGMTYDVYVAAVCNGDTSYYGFGTVTLGCGALTASDLPYSEDFESYGSGSSYDINACWHKGTSSSTAYPYPYTTAAINGSRGLYFYGYHPSSTSSTPIYSWAALPPVDDNLDISTLQLNMNMKRYSTVSNYYTTILWVGVADSLTGLSSAAAIESSITWIDTIDLTSATASSIHNLEVSFADYAGNGKYVFLYAPTPELVGTSTYRYNYVYVDDIVLRNIPTCYWPTTAQLTDISTDEAEISWTPDPRTLNPSSWDIEYDVSGFVPGSGNSATASGNTILLSNLTANTEYDVYITANCGNGDVSDPYVFTFRTLCDYLETLPYTQDFESAATGSSTSEVFVECMHRLNNGSQYFGYPYVSATSSYNHTSGGTRGLYWFGSTTQGTYGDYQIVVLPGVDPNDYPVNNLQLKFWARATSTSYHPVFQVGVMTNPMDANTFQSVGTVNVEGTDYTEYTVALGEYTGNGNYVAIRALRPSSSWYATVDDITLEEMPDCPAVVDLEATATVGSALLTWDYQSGYEAPTGYTIVYDSIGGSNPTTVTSTDPTYAITGLEARTTYKAYVSADCNGFADSVEFTTGPFSNLEFAGGTTTTYYLPIGNFYNYSYTQQLIMASEMNGPTTLTGIDFEYAYSSPSTSKTNVSIYLANVSTTSLSSAFTTYDASTFKLVYTGNLNCSQGWNHFDFDTVFSYDGTSNLLIFVHDNSGDYDGSSYTFYAHSATGKGRYIQNDSDPYALTGSPGTGTSVSYRANMRLHFIDTADVVCAAPGATVTYIGIDTVIVSWIPGYNETAWDVAYREASASTWTTVATGVSVNEYVFDSLTPGTDYEFRISFECDDNNATVYSTTVEASTQCVPVTLPYTENFDDVTTSTSTTNYGLMPNCWNYTMTGTSVYQTGSYLPRVYYSTSTNYVHSGNYCLYLYGVGIFELPEMPTTIDSLMISFYDYVSSSSYGLIVGAMEDGVFVPIDTATLVSSTPNFVEFNLNRYHGTSRKIALRNYYTTSTTTYYSYNYIDNIYVDYIPSCPHVDNLHSTSVTGDSIYLAWTAGSTETEWIVSDGINEFATNTNSIGVGNLVPNTAYQMSVRPVCSDSDTGRAMTVTVVTACPEYMILPYSNDFEDDPHYTVVTYANAFPHCWDRINDASGTYNYYPYLYATSSYAHSGSTGMYWYHTTTTTYADNEYAVLPPVDTLTTPMNTLSMSFYIKTTSTSYHPQPIVGVMSGTDTSTFVPVYSFTATEVSTAWQEKTISFESFTGTGNRIAIKWPRPSSYSYMAIDDIEVWKNSSCGTPTYISANNISNDNATINWGDTVSYPSVTIFWGRVNSVAAAEDSVVVSGVTSHIINNLIGNTTYYVWVRGNCSEEPSRMVTTSFLTAPDCSPVENLAVAGTDYNAFGLSWDAPTTGHAATAYVVSWRESGTTAWSSDTTNDTYYYISGLTLNTPYQYTVTTLCNEEVSAANSGTVSTLGCGQQITDGGTNYAYLPTNQYYSYSYTQQLYMADELAGVDSIANIAFKVEDGYTADLRNVTVYLGNTSKSSFSGTTDYIPASALTQVYTGTLSGSGWINLHLTNVFARIADSNLVVVVDDNTGSYTSTIYWGSTATSSARSLYFYQDGSDITPASPTASSEGAVYYVNQILVSGSTCATPSCGAPIIFASAATENSISINWNTEPGATYEVAYRMEGAVNWTIFQTGNTTGICNITGLTPSADWNIRVSFDCNGDTLVGTRTVATLCGPAALPLSENFQNREYGVFERSCWITGTTNLGTDYPYPYVISLSGAADNKLCLIYNGGYLILPKVDAPLNELQIRFKLTQGGDNVRLLMGTTSDPTLPINAMHVLDTLIRSDIDTTTSTVNITYSFENISLADTGNYICFWDAFNDNYSFLDDIVVEYIPLCTPAADFTVTTTTNSADISWTTNGQNGTSYIIEYGPRYFTPGTGTQITSTSSPVTITGLNHSTSYDAYVYTICGGLGDTSIESQVIMFQTPCDVITTLPYFTDFENIMSPGSSATDVLPNCWAAESPSGTMPHIYYTSTTNYTSSPTHCFYYYNLGVAALPQFGVPLDTLMISFHDYNSTPSSYGLIIGTVDSVTPGFAASFQPIDTIVFENGVNSYDVVSYLTDYTGNASYIAIKNYNTSATATYAYHYIDDLTVDYVPACIAPQRVHTTLLLNDSASIAWTVSQASSYTVEYGVHGFTPGTGTVITTNTRSATFSNLTANTQYDVYLVSGCGSDTTFFTFTTLRSAPVTQYPYICDFSDSTERAAWTPVSGTAANTWTVGSAAHYGTNDNYSMYVTNDNGTSNAYTISSISHTYSMRTFAMNAGSYNIAFNWQCYGEGNYDYVRAYLVPTSLAVEAGIAPNGGTSSNSNATAAPQAGWIALGSKLNLSSSWQSFSEDVAITTAGTYNLVFYWGNDGSVGTQPPAAIDNVEVYINTCPAPIDLYAESVGSTTINLDWTDMTTAQSWIVEYGPTGYVHGSTSANTVAATSHPVLIQGLDTLTSYDFYVRSVCTGDDTGRWSHPVTLMTNVCDNGSTFVNYTDNQSSSTSSYYGLGYTYYPHTYNQTIIDSSYMANMNGDISALGFFANTSAGGNYVHNVSIWLANVPEANLANGWIMPDDSLHIFVNVLDSADLTFSTTGMHVVQFDTSFTWDGHSNILMAIIRSEGTSSYGSSYTTPCHYVSGSPTMTRYSYSTTVNYNINTTPGGTTSTSTYHGDFVFFACGGPACPEPSILPATDVTYQSATINWNSNATDFEVSVKAATDGVWPAEVSVSNATSYSVTNLTPATTYQFRVRAICDATEGLISEWAMGTFTTDSLPCFVPTDLHTTAVGYTTANLAWSASSEQNHWTLTVWNTAGAVDYDVTGNAAYTVTGLTQDNQYYAAVKAICGNGAAESEYSDTIQFTTDNCEQVAGVTVNNITENSAVVSWQAASATSYEVDYGPVGHGQGQGTTVTVNNATTYTITGLESETGYSVYVRALCEADAPGPWSQVQEFTTLESGIGIDVADGMNVSIYPNPTSSTTTIALSGVNGDVAITVVDMNGRVVMSDSMSCEGDCVKTMEVSGLAQGAYFVRINGENVNMVKKLVVK